MFSLFKKKIPDFWDFTPDPKISGPQNIAESIKRHLDSEGHQAVFEFSETFFEYTIAGKGMKYQLRFQIKSFGKDSISLQSITFKVIPEELNEVYKRMRPEGDYVLALSFDNEIIEAATEMKKYKEPRYDCNYAAQMPKLVNDMGFFWRIGCKQVMNRLRDTQSIHHFLNEWKPEWTKPTSKEFHHYLSLTCMTSILLKKEWRELHASYKDRLHKHEENRTYLEEFESTARTIEA